MVSPTGKTNKKETLPARGKGLANNVSCQSSRRSIIPWNDDLDCTATPL